MSKILWLILIGNFTIASEIFARNKKDTIHLNYTEYGKLKSNNHYSFKLIAGETYTFKITVDAPVNQHAAFLIAIAKKLQATDEKLNDPSYKYDELYRAIWGNIIVDKIKSETKELLDSLTVTNPAKAFKNSNNVFEYFMGQKFLTKNLFEQVFKVTNNLEPSSSYTGSWKDEAEFSFTYSPKKDEDINLRIYIANMEKSFYEAYFIESRKEIVQYIDTIKKNNFYENALLELANLDTSILNFTNKIKHLPAKLLCLDEYNEFKNLETIAGKNSLLNVMKSNWYKRWVWFNEGEIALNPLPFTDENLVPKTAKADSIEKEKAEQYNALRKGSIELLMEGNTINEQQVDTKVFDSLVMQSGLGVSKFVSNTYAKRLAANKKEAIAYQQIKSAINRATFYSYEKKEYKKNNMLLYDAATNKLTAHSSNASYTLPAHWQNEVIAYNVGNGQSITVTEKNEAIPDQSAAIAGLNTAGSALGIISGNIGKVQNIGATFAGISSSSLKNVGKINFEPSFEGNPAANSEGGEANTLRLKKAYDLNINSRIITHYFKLFFSVIDKTLWVNVAYKFPKDQDGFVIIFKENLSAKLYRELTNQLDGAEDCIYKDMNTQMINQFKNEIWSFAIKENNEDIQLKIDEKLKIITDYLNTQIQAKINLLRTRTDEFNNFLQTSNIGPIYTAYQNMSLILPPRAYLAKTDTTPNFFNSIHPLDKVETANKKSLTITLMDTENKKILRSRTDAFKTAPRHWVLPSMGLGYVFNNYTLAEAKITNGSIEKREAENQLRLMAGLHFYPLGVIMADDRSIFTVKDWYRRLALYTGTSFPKPLENLHYGLSVDVWAGIKITGGIHNYRYTAYKIQNGEIAKSNPKYVSNGGFLSLQIEPLTFIKLFGILN